MEIIVREPTEEEVDEAVNWDIWTKKPAVFDWHYEEEETCLILEGFAIITTEDGESIEICEGDWVIFPEGLDCTWEIKEKIVKHFKSGLI